MKKRRIKQKLLGITLIVIGWCSVPIECDATFALFATLLGSAMIFTKDNVL